MFDGFAPKEFRNDPKKRTEWAKNQLILAAKASKNLGIKVHVTFSGALVFGPFISSDKVFICLSNPSKTMINLFGVENEKLFFDLIDFSKKNFRNSSRSFSLKFF